MPDRTQSAATREAAEHAWRIHMGAPVDAGTLRDRLVRGSLAEAFHATALESPDRPAVAIGPDTLTHGELDELAGRFAAWLSTLGVRTGDAVLLSAPPSVRMIVAYVGALRAGAVVVLASPALGEAEREYIAGSSGAVVALVAGPASGMRVRGRQGLRAVVALDAGASDPFELEAALGTQDAQPIAGVDGYRTALLAYTSGTTGTPKAVPLTHANLLASIRSAMLAWRWQRDDVLVHALPLSHQHGLGGLHATLLAGSRLTLLERFDPDELLRTLVAEHGTVLFAVPTMYERMLAAPALADLTPRALRLAVSGSAPLSPSLASRVADALGQVPLERYGTTESGLNVSNPLDGQRRPGFVGLPLPGVELAVVDGDGVALADGQSGEIVLRGPQLFGGYRDEPDATADAFFAGGWFRTGDIGTIDPRDGYLAITGRSKELIISGGMNVYPREVELALESHPSVRQAGVAGVPSERWGEEVVAAVVPADAGRFDAGAVLDAMRTRLAGYKRPKRILAVERLPASAVGKLERDELVRLLAGAEERDADPVSDAAASAEDGYRRMLAASERRLLEATFDDVPGARPGEPW